MSKTQAHSPRNSKRDVGTVKKIQPLKLNLRHTVRDPPHRPSLNHIQRRNRCWGNPELDCNLIKQKKPQQPIDLPASSSRWLQCADRLNSSAWTYVQRPTPSRADGANCWLCANQTQHPWRGITYLRRRAGVHIVFWWTQGRSFSLKTTAVLWLTEFPEKQNLGLFKSHAWQANRWYFESSCKEPFCGLKFWLLEDAMKVARSGT